MGVFCPSAMSRIQASLVFLVTSCSLVVVVSSLLAKFEPVLLFPQPTFFQFTVAVTTPVAMDKKGGLGFNSGFQFNYALPWNLSQFEPTVVHARSTRQAAMDTALNVDNVYLAIEELLEDHGWSDGRECLLRVICELAQTPLVTSHDGRDVLEEIVRLLLTPSEDAEDNGYVEAELLGRVGAEDCGAAYAGCLQSPLDSFTEIVAPGFG